MSLSAQLSVLAISAALATVPSAQEQSLPLQKPEIRYGAEPMRSVVFVTYDVQHDRVSSSRQLPADALLRGTPPCFDNSVILDIANPGYIIANTGEDLLAWGTKNCPGASRLRNFTIAYRSEADDVAVGGPGAIFSIALYDGANGFGRPGTEIFRRTFTGMPGNAGGMPAIFFTVDFGTNPLPLNDGSFGWSFLQLDGNTGPVAVQAPTPLLGTADALDIYRPGPARTTNYQGTYNYGGCNNYPFRCANMWLQLDEIANNEVALTTELNGNGVNPVLLHEVLPARIGQIWAATIDADVLVPVGPYTLLFTSLGQFGPAPSPYGEILIDPAQRLMGPLPGEAGYTFSIPPDTALVGFRFYTQAAVLPPALPAITLTNALRVRLGY